MSAEDSQVHICIASRFENIELVQVVLEDSLKRLETDEDTCYWIGIALREALANAIKHGNRQDPEKKVDIDLAVEDDALVIRIADLGEGFDPAQIEDPLTPENLLKRDGRGIFYMRKFMDGVQFSFRPGGGTVVTMRKRIGRKSSDMNPQEEEDR